MMTSISFPFLKRNHQISGRKPKVLCHIPFKPRSIFTRSKLKIKSHDESGQGCSEVEECEGLADAIVWS